MIVLDSISTLLHAAAENEAESWAPIQAWLLGHRFRGRSFIFVTHEGKNRTARGTSKREDVIDVSIGLREQKQANQDDNTSSFELRFDKKRELVGKDAAAMLLHLSTKTGTAEWSYEALREPGDETRDKVTKLRDQGKSQKQIGKEVGLSQSQVSRLLNSDDED